MHLWHHPPVWQAVAPRPLLLSATPRQDQIRKERHQLSALSLYIYSYLQHPMYAGMLWPPLSSFRYAMHSEGRVCLQHRRALYTKSSCADKKIAAKYLRAAQMRHTVAICMPNNP